jgi:ABC-type multidrug transport system permease subunit
VRSASSTALDSALRADSARLAPRVMADTAAMRALRSGELALVVAPSVDGTVEYLTSFLFSRLTVLVIEVITLVGFGTLIFGVPLRGSLIELAIICLLASFSFGALGLLVASRARTMEGASGLMNLVMLPMWIFSGVFFSASNFPAALQPFVQALPLTAVNDALRANMLQGASLPQLSGEILVVLVWMLLSFVLALKLFRWQ